MPRQNTPSIRIYLHLSCLIRAQKLDNYWTLKRTETCSPTNTTEFETIKTYRIEFEGLLNRLHSQLARQVAAYAGLIPQQQAIDTQGHSQSDISGVVVGCICLAIWQNGPGVIGVARRVGLARASSLGSATHCRDSIGRAARVIGKGTSGTNHGSRMTKRMVQPYICLPIASGLTADLCPPPLSGATIASGGFSDK